MVVLICGLGIKMMMDQLIRGPGFMPPPQARPPMALNLIDPSPNSSKKVRKQIDYYFSNSDEDSKAPFPGFDGSFIMAPRPMDKKWAVKVGSATSTRELVNLRTRAFSEGTIKSIKSEWGRSGIRSSSLDADLCEESSESVSDENSSEEGADSKTDLPKDGTDDEDSSGSSKGIPDGDQDVDLDKENKDWLGEPVHSNSDPLPPDKSLKELEDQHDPILSKQVVVEEQP
ncbi:hypothetical protein Sjap_000692 [Stephania japonica]|uniref:Uncharacterized protein n=1 Tax=Stephania japonica TaxID=461633 RepID=A0AAP0KKY4_9MAGN